MTAISVVVATCGRPRDLAQCLRSLLAQTHPAERIIVVDDAPGSASTPGIVECAARRGPVEYAEGARRGLADAHNRGLRHVDSPLIAFTDDDVLAAPTWLERITVPFALDSRVACVTGLIVPRELETRPQQLLEAYAGFGKGVRRRVFDLAANRPDDPLFPFTAGALGSGANMAFRRAALEEAGGFDPALGAGTAACGGDDLAAFFEVLQRGHRLVYEPSAIVQHRHAREYAALKRQVYGYGVGLTAYLTKSVLDRPALAGQAMARAPGAAAHIFSRGSAKNSRLPEDYPRELVWLERLGMLAGPFAYLASRWRVARAA